jgi:anhydro-N-acetylmuramic acid kinase
MACYIGLMSGTSLDGVDAVLAHETCDGVSSLRAAAHVALPMPEALREELLALNRSGDDELHRAALAANAISELYATAVARLLQDAGVATAEVAAIGAHGQTVRHRPQAFGGSGYTLQLINGALLAERTGIAVVCDFRSRDLAAGGQGAPLVPAFHAACFALPDHDVAVLNLGGIANLTLLPARGTVSGFDCGPGNLLMDLWCRRHRGSPYDTGGDWAAGGQVDHELLGRLLAEPFFALAPPKSTGRDLFGAAWLDARLGTANVALQDVMATLADVTARAAVQAMRRHAPTMSTLLVCGGGVYNRHLMSRLAALAGAEVAVASTATVGLAPDQVEALAFAWLARAHLLRLCGNLPSVTGARGPRVLGALYPA